MLELIRAKYHVIVSYEFQVKNATSNLISGYHRDVQMTKEPTMRSLEIAEECLSIMSLIFTKLRVNKENCQKALPAEIYAAEHVYELVEKGIPFREAHNLVGEAVQLAENSGKSLDALTDEELESISPKFILDLAPFFDPQQSINRRNCTGGSAPESVKAQIQQAWQVLPNNHNNH